jgi:4-diphosphocytidyl-2-C-methyl-D-erythritol kinase
MSAGGGRLAVAAKINLSLVVGPTRADGLHELASVMQRVDLCDELELAPGPGPGVEVEGFEEDTLVRTALDRLAAAAGVVPAWQVHLRKEIPLAAGLGGGSADAAAALVLANRSLERPLASQRLLEVAAGVGADVPFFVDPGPKLAQGAGERLTPLGLPQDYLVVLAFPREASKPSTGEIYRRFDALDGAAGFEGRRAALMEALASCTRARDLARLPGNDLAAASGAPAFGALLLEAGAFRADVSGAGPTTYGLFLDRREAETAAAALDPRAQTWVVAPVW